jgi:signal transduction histidine kinase
MESKEDFRVKDFSASEWLFVFMLLAGQLAGALTLSAQDKSSIQIKAFDHQLKPFPNLEISFDGKTFFSLNNKGSAFVEVVSSDLPPKSVTFKNEELEAESWNYSKGVVEIIVRKKSYKIQHWVVKDINANPIPNLTINFQGRKNHVVTSDANGKFDLPMALDERITSLNQFTVSSYEIKNASDNSLIVQPVQIVDAEAGKKLNQIPKDYFKNFDLAMLDSIQSLTMFYAIFKNYQISDFTPKEKTEIDRKFNQLVKQLQDSAKQSDIFIGKISESSYVNDDIRNLLAQAEEEKQMLEAQQEDFDEKIKLISEKLSTGMENLEPQTRKKLLADISLLETLLLDNENRFFKNQNEYRQVISSLKEKFFDFTNLENRLSESELQRLEQEQIFRQRMVIIVSIASVFAVMIVLLIRFSNKLRKQKVQLEEANAEIKRMNENLEILVYVRTKLLAEAHKELDTFLYRASHDLRSPVCSIIGLCNIASSQLPGGESKELIDRVVTTTENMDKLLKKLSLISEINQPSNFSEIRLLEVFQGIENRFRTFIRDNNVQFKIHCEFELSINSYPNLVNAILTNVIENALYYSTMKHRAGATIEVRATVEENRAVVSVYDNGIGIDPAVQPRIFDMFYKGNTRSKGNGLGLYIVNKSLQALEGEIKLESVVNEYSRFIMYFPVNLAPVSPQLEEALQEA